MASEAYDPSDPSALLVVEGLVKHFSSGGGFLRRRPDVTRAVDGVSFSIGERETLALVGESGSGKSTIARLVMHLETPTEGRGRLLDKPLFDVSTGELRELRRHMQMVFQDPFGSLNPRRTVGQLVMEPWQVHEGMVPRDEQRERAADLFEKVGLKPDHIDRYPAAFSGGQRQRVGIARALALNPSLVICDEAVSALDVSIQAQVLNLLADVQEELGLSYLFISHDLSVVRHLADRVAVLYLGRLVEIGDHQAVYGRPAHPYTQALLTAVPSMDLDRRGTRAPVRISNASREAAHDGGCVFRSRCWKADARCESESPPLVQQAAGHWAACHYPES